MLIKIDDIFVATFFFVALFFNCCPYCPYCRWLLQYLLKPNIIFNIIKYL